MKIESFINNIDINTLSMPDVLGKLAAGDVIRAKILDATSKQLTLKLFDGTVFDAKMLSSLEAELGDIVDFVVKSNSNGQLILETLKENGNNQKNINDTSFELKKQLIELGIKPDKNNIEIAEAIKQNEIPLSKNIFNKIADTIIALKNVTPQKAAFLIANKIAPEKENLALLNRIVDEKQKVGTMLKSTFESLSKLTDKNTMESLSKILIDNPEKEIAQYGKSVAKSSDQQNAVLRNIVDSVFSSKEQNNDLMLSEVKQKLQEFASEFLKNTSEEVLKFTKDENLFTDKALSYLKENISNFETTPINRGEPIENIIKNLFHQLKANTKEEKNPSEYEISLKKPIESDEYKKQLEEAFEKFNVKINETTTKEDLKIKDIYKDLYKKLELIKNAVTQSADLQKDDILNKIENLQSNLKFINDINNHSIFLQIPLNIQGRNTTGDIYVLKKRYKNKKIDPQNASVLISLNTPNLGQIDSLITVNKKNISLNFRVEEQSIISIIKENYIQIYNSLLDKGYKLVDVKYRLIEEEINVINAEHIMLKELDLNKQSIDYKI